MKKIIFTGGSGKFGKVFKKFNFNKKNIYYPSSNTFDVTNLKKMEKIVKKIRPKFIIHAAAVSRLMNLIILLMILKIDPDTKSIKIL